MTGDLPSIWLEAARRVGWTGHRPELFADPLEAERRVHRLAREIKATRVRVGLQEEPLHFLSGGQRGVDTWAAEAAVRLGIPFELYLPTGELVFTLGWQRSDQERLFWLMERAAGVFVADPLGQMSREAAYRERNREVAARCDVLVAVWVGQAGGGTAETVALARAMGKPVREERLPGSGYRPRLGERGI